VPGIDLSLCVILDREIGHDLTVEQFTRQVISGGATCLQVRLKDASAREMLDFATLVLGVARPLGIPVVVNDRVDVALAAGADGVHVGEEDLPVVWARRLAGPAMVVGASAASVEAARQAQADGADYVGVGPVFRSPTKPNVEPIAPDLIPAIRREISLPIVAIGGITIHNLHVPIRQGADGIAIISALRQCLTPGEVASRLKESICKAKKG